MIDLLSSQEDFTDQHFDGVDAKKALFEEKIFENCTFSKCNFSSTNFKQSKFLDCRFEHCDLSNMEIRGASLRSVNFSDCKLIGVNWTNASAISHLVIENCILNYSNFKQLQSLLNENPNITF